MKACPYCSNALQNEAAFCTYCGKSLIAATSHPKADVISHQATQNIEHISQSKTLLGIAPSGSSPMQQQENDLPTIAFSNTAKASPQQFESPPAPSTSVQNLWSAGEQSRPLILDPAIQSTSQALSETTLTDSAFAPTMFGDGSQQILSPTRIEATTNSSQLTSATADIAESQTICPMDVSSKPVKQVPGNLVIESRDNPDSSIATISSSAISSATSAASSPLSSGYPGTVPLSHAFPVDSPVKTRSSSLTTALERLASIPDAIPSSLWASGIYYLKVQQARWQRWWLLRAIRREMLPKENKLTNLLHTVGQQARLHEVNSPLLERDMHALLQIEAEYARALREKAAIDTRLQEEEKSFATIAASCNKRIQIAKQEIADIEINLKNKKIEQRNFRSRSPLPEKKLTADDIGGVSPKARLSTSNPLLPGDDATMGISSGSDFLANPNSTTDDDIAAKTDAVEHSITELKEKLQDRRICLVNAQKELTAAKHALNLSKRAIKIEENKKKQEISMIDNSLSQKHLDIGKIVDAHREQVEGTVFNIHFEQLDQLRQEMQHWSERMTILTTEREAYDHEAAQRGRLLLCSLGGVVLLIVVAVLLIF